MSNSTPARFSLSLRISIGAAFVGIVVLTSALLGAASFLSLRSFIRNGIREELRKYVPADLVADLMKLSREAVLSSERRDISIFFSDIENFTAISEQLPPEQLIDCLSLYFKGMTGAILNHRGTVDKYIGDSIMAFWGAPSPVDNHAVPCCLAALQ